MPEWGFVNPPNMATWHDFTDNPVYVEGSTVNLVWEAPSDIATSVTMFQANLTDGFVIGRDFEYVTKSVVNATDFQWRVGTSRDTTVSNVFLLSIYVEGGTDVMATSHYFNISSKSVKSTTTTSSSILSTTTSSSISVPSGSTSSTESLLSAPTSTASTTTPPTANSNGLDKEAIIGMGVAIPCAVIIGAAAGWFFFGRRRRSQQIPRSHIPDNGSTRDGISMTSPEHSSVYTTTQRGQFYGEIPRQISPPAEMTGQTKPLELQQQYRDYELSGESRAVPSQHYELYAPGPERPRMNSF
ncbi:hypothetical protein diail_1306 [Diaporthe ilicicola]|nr:hypothetical protein diail_1306 [Diaporthe ilicicola]